MMDYVSIGSAPYAEPCAQVGSPNYQEHARKECTVFRNQLRRQFGEVPGAYFKIKPFPHDFGTYYEVCVIFSDEDERATAFAYKVEDEGPEYWDEVSCTELGITYTPRG